MSRAAAVPGPRTFSPGGSYRPFARDPLGFLTGLRRTYGTVARFRVGPRRVYLLSDPELVREVLVVHAARVRKDRGLEAARTVLGDGLLTSSGETWRRHRRLVQPAFHPDRIAAYAPVMAARAAARVERWRDGQRLDAAAEMAALALEIVAAALFGAEVGREVDRIAATVGEAVDAFRISRIPLAPLLDRLPVASTRRVRRAREALDRTVLGFVAARRARPGDDLVSALIGARDAEGGLGLTDREVRDEAMTLFLAGHETTANALAWTIDLVGRHPEVEARLRDEVARATRGRPPSAKDVPCLEYVRRVLTEAMRLYPPAWTVARRAVEDLELPGVTIRRGETAVMSQWVIHRDPVLYPEPERFDPDRWLPERHARLPRLAYFPFGAGPRICVGEGFAWTEAVLALAAIVRRVRLVPLSPTPPVPVPRITLRPGGGVPVRVEVAPVRFDAG
ncbi:cytochrome P450 [Anaeromyxobacter terrae]|uniref:cytochrome P450 n=1 Tax=Anaeromyxobacter terrae TaxID=2925406 RepID=UPI001F5A1355|nr:cytochrome P450 [Anaeromyxobacter sp. SG22]